MKTIRNKSPQFKRWLRQLNEQRIAHETEAREAAEVIIREVRDEGDRAVARSVRKFDGASLRPNELLDRIPQKSTTTPERMAVIDAIIDRITRFHEKQVVESYEITSDGGVFGHLVRPLERVGLYVPGGKAVHLTTLMMCAIPARLAGVEDMVVATTLQASKSVEFRSTCARLGIKEIYRAGGAAAIAAMAYGTQTLKRVAKIVGPGNRYVSAAKAILTGTVGVDMTTGGGEAVVVVDEASNHSRLAMDLLAQAERGEDGLVVCIAVSDDAAKAIVDAVTALRRRKGSGSAGRMLSREAVVITVSSDKEAVQLVNLLGPQRVSLQTRNADDLVQYIGCAASIFVGPSSMLTAGSLGVGVNEVLPTRGTARFFSPLGVYDFYKRSNMLELSEAHLAEFADSATQLAEMESLPHHAHAIRDRDKADA